MHTEKEVIRIWTESPDLEDLNQVVKLAVNVADNGDGGSNVYDITLFHQQLLRLGAYRLNNRICQQFTFVDPFDALVQVDASYIAKINKLGKGQNITYYNGSGRTNLEDLA